MPTVTPRQGQRSRRGAGNAEQNVSTDDGGIAITRITPAEKPEKRHTGNEAQPTKEGQPRLTPKSTSFYAMAKTKADLRQSAPLSRWRAHQLKVFSTKARGEAYVDIVKEGQNLLTGDLELEITAPGRSFLTAPEIAGTVGLSAYLFGRDARTVGDHQDCLRPTRDELKSKQKPTTLAYKPGAEARIRLPVTTPTAKGPRRPRLQVVAKPSVFAVAEKQPDSPKVISSPFYTRPPTKESHEPRYEQSFGMPA